MIGARQLQIQPSPVDSAGECCTATGTSGAPFACDVALDLGQRAAELLIASFQYWPDKAVCRELDLSFGTWRAIKTRRHRPSSVLLTHLFARLGPNFVAACVAPWSEAGPGVVGFQRAQPEDKHATPQRTRRRA